MEMVLELSVTSPSQFSLGKTGINYYTVRPKLTNQFWKSPREVFIVAVTFK